MKFFSRRRKNRGSGGGAGGEGEADETQSSRQQQKQSPRWRRWRRQKQQRQKRQEEGEVSQRHPPSFSNLRRAENIAGEELKVDEKEHAVPQRKDPIPSPTTATVEDESNRDGDDIRLPLRTQKQHQGDQEEEASTASDDTTAAASTASLQGDPTPCCDEPADEDADGGDLVGQVKETPIRSCLSLGVGSLSPPSPPPETVSDEDDGELSFIVVNFWPASSPAALGGGQPEGSNSSMAPADTDTAGDATDTSDDDTPQSPSTSSSFIISIPPPPLTEGDSPFAEGTDPMNPSPNAPPADTGSTPSATDTVSIPPTASRSVAGAEEELKGEGESEPREGESEPREEESKPREEESKSREEESEPREEVSKPREEVSELREEESKPREEESKLEDDERKQDPGRDNTPDVTAPKPAARVFQRQSSSFLRVADLFMEGDDGGVPENISISAHSSMSEDGGGVGGGCESNENEALPPENNFHRVSVDPPPGIDVDPKERWVALDDGVTGSAAPIASAAVSALAGAALRTALDSRMWQPDSKSSKLLSKHKNGSAWYATTFDDDGPIRMGGDSKGKDRQEQLQQVLVWTGSFQHGLYGSDLPLVRSAGVVPMPPEALVDLLVDSSRVFEYNKLSLGRTDLLVLQGDMSNGSFGGITKIMRSASKPPLVRKALQFTSLFHARVLDDGSGYLMATRAVTAPDPDGESSVLKSEILLGVTLIKKIQGDGGRCLMINVNHVRSPMVPMMIAKRIGLQAAVGFFGDLRSAAAAAS